MNFSLTSRLALTIFPFSLLFAAAANSHETLSTLERLGKSVFFEPISNPATQSCGSCHDPSTGWTTPLSDTAVMPGAVGERFGNRKPPSNAYIVFSPVRDVEERTGGALWDARADGTAIASLNLAGVDPELLGPAADQSVLPFTNPLEHNISEEDLCLHVEREFGDLYEEAWSQPIDCSVAVEESVARIGLSIVAYEKSEEVSPFASRFDAGALSPFERRGFELFADTCTGCHAIAEDAQPGDGSQQLFTGFKTFNIGVPRNPDNPFYTMDSVFGNDGLPINAEGIAFQDVGDGDGRVKTPTLRNVAKTPYPGFIKRFMHNGYFNSLESIVHFYNTRDIKAACPPDFDIDEALENDCWPEPENTENLAGAGTDEVDMGNLGLTSREEASIVAFLRTLTDNNSVRVPGQRDFRRDTDRRLTERRSDFDRDGDRNDRDRFEQHDHHDDGDRDGRGSSQPSNEFSFQGFSFDSNDSDNGGRRFRTAGSGFGDDTDSRSRRRGMVRGQISRGR